MSAEDRVNLVRPSDRVEGEYTPGMIREQAVAVDGMWAGLVRTEAHMTTGWHHHADYDTSIYVIDGSLRMESGPGGNSVVEAGPGDFVHVPRVRSIGRPTRVTRRATSLWSVLVAARRLLTSMGQRRAEPARQS